MTGNAAGVCGEVTIRRWSLRGQTTDCWAHCHKDKLNASHHWQLIRHNNSQDETETDVSQHTVCQYKECMYEVSVIWSDRHTHCLSKDSVRPSHLPSQSSPRLWSNSPLGEWRVHPQSTTRHTPRHPVSLPALAGHRPWASCLQDRGVSGVCGSCGENSGCCFVFVFLCRWKP